MVGPNEGFEPCPMHLHLTGGCERMGIWAPAGLCATQEPRRIQGATMSAQVEAPAQCD